ncbi:MAG: hypothetical protein ACQUHE_05135 [Bacteroidia bacterium]
MKYICLLLAIATITFTACNTKPKASGTSNLAHIQNSATSPFSDTLRLDTFKVALEGNNAKESKLNFKIIAHDGKEIYNTSIKGYELLKTNAKLKTESDKMNFLKDRIKYFFEDEHFLWPAVLPNEKPNNNVADLAFYDELKQSQLNGFNYHIGEESKIYIAWSAKENKVKVYYKL